LTAAGFAPARAADAGIVAFVHTQPAGDNGTVDGMVASLKRLGATQGVPVRSIYASDPSTFETVLQLLGEAGASVVITTFLEMAAPLRAVAPAFPKTHFLQLYGDPVEPPIPNLRTVSYDYYAGCYLSGMFGAQFSKSRKIGYIGGATMLPENADLNAVRFGAQSVDPAVTFSGTFAGSFTDPQKGLDIADQMYRTGIDYIQTDAAATDQGIIASANSRPGRYVSAGSRQQLALGPASVVGIVLVDFPRSLYDQATLARQPHWTGGHVRSGLGDGVIDFLLSDLFLARADAATVAAIHRANARVTDAKHRIIAGTLRVPMVTSLSNG
jgi:basic membrane protein A